MVNKETLLDYLRTTPPEEILKRLEAMGIEFADLLSEGEVQYQRVTFNEPGTCEILTNP